MEPLGEGADEGALGLEWEGVVADFVKKGGVEDWELKLGGAKLVGGVAGNVDPVLGEAGGWKGCSFSV